MFSKNDFCYLWLTFLLLNFQVITKGAINDRTASIYSFIVAGHAYGSHNGTNIGLHPNLLNCLNIGYDTSAAFIVLTGDIVNNSTTESWQQVEVELANYDLPAYYVMGNHDVNDIGIQEFVKKFGNTYYAFHTQTELYIVLNSTEEERSISAKQIYFLEEQINLVDDTIQNIFIFFHEILWNSHEKYMEVKSNSRSRYNEMANYSNYWEDVHPILIENPDKKFFVIAGDVGGNPDAIAAFYDKCNNVTLIASGMGEVIDENYLLVHVYKKDSVGFELIPLNNELSLPEIEFFSVPPAVGNITGPATVVPGSTYVEYSVPEVFNADSYIWELPGGATGSSTTNRIYIDFDLDFSGGYISVKASREGFGSGPVSSIIINAGGNSIESQIGDKSRVRISIIEKHDFYTIRISGLQGDVFSVLLYDSLGKLLKFERIASSDNQIEMSIDQSELVQGIILLSVIGKVEHITKKFIAKQ